MTDMVRAPMSELETRRFLKNGQKPMMTDDEKNELRMQAIASHNDYRRYERLALEADYPDEHQLWVDLRDRARLKMALTLSVLEVEE